MKSSKKIGEKTKCNANPRPTAEVHLSKSIMASQTMAKLMRNKWQEDEDEKEINRATFVFHFNGSIV